MHFRTLKIEDAEDINRLSGQLGYPSSLSETEISIKAIITHPGHCSFVAITEETIIGWIHGFYALRLESPPFVEIGGLVVDENYRNMQTGKKLIELVKEWAITQEVGKLKVRCQTKRTGSHQFYLKAGFIQTKEQKIFDMAINP